MFDEDSHTPVLQVLTGHFHKRAGYRAVRRAGVADWLLIYTTGGLGRFGHAGGDLMAQPGDWVLLRPGTPHDYGVEPTLRRWDLLWAHFQPCPDWRPLLAWPEVQRGLMRLSIDPKEGRPIVTRFGDVVRLLGSSSRHRELAAMNALEDVILRCDAHSPTVPARGDARIRRAMDFMDANLAERININDIAAESGLSPSRLSHLFKAETGISVQRYLETARMRHAAELLRRTSFSIKQIAAAVGFPDPLYFSQRFRVFTEASPTDYREKATSLNGL